MPSELTRGYLLQTAKLLAAAVLLGLGLLMFNHNRLTLTHQKPYYARLYAGIIEYEVGNWLADLRGANTQAATAPKYAQSVPVLLYHGVLANPGGENLSEDNFVRQLVALKRAGWQTVSIQDFHDFMYRGKRLPGKSFLLTFDDGRKDSFYPVDPLLAALHYRATMFVITKSSFTPVENKFYLDKEELAIMKHNGRWDLQPHAAYGHYLYPINAHGKLGHYYDSKLWLADQHRLETDQEFTDRTLGDLKLAKTDMQQEVGSSGIAFAFPFNEFGGASINYPGAGNALLANVKAVYPIAFYQIWPNKGNSQNFPQDKSFLMKRILVDSSLDSTKLLATMRDTSPKTLPYVSKLTTDTGAWLHTWGDQHWKKDGLTIEASKDGTGAATFLDGGGAWRDYSTTAHFSLTKGQWARVLGRFHDDKNYVACTYSDNSVLLEEIVNGVDHDLGEAGMSVPVGDFVPTMEVKGHQVGCQVNGQTVLSSDRLDPHLGYGDAGFASFGPAVGNSQLRISNVRISPLN